MPSNTSLYIHIPFCSHRCAYCDFNTYAGLEELIPPYVEALIREIDGLAYAAKEPISVHTLFFGGGTPSLLPAKLLAQILTAVSQNYVLHTAAEITLEANPGTLSPEYLTELRQMGINRLSLGVQSASPEELRLLERQHDFLDVIRSVRWARQAGFANLNLDLIFALPGQSLASWQNNLEQALALGPEHLSLYALSFEHGTPFRDRLNRGLMPLPDPDLAAEMYEWADKRLGEAGYEHYEISNWARHNAKGELLSCQHNLQYWRNLPYIGFGAGAHGWVGGLRTMNVLSPAAYIQRLASKKEFAFPRTAATSTAAKVDSRQAMAETMMMGLRLLKEGVSQQEFAERFGTSPDSVYSTEIEQLQSKHLLERSGPKKDRLRLTRQAALLGNLVFSEFV